MTVMIDPAGKDAVVQYTAPPIKPSQQAGASVWETFERNRASCFSGASRVPVFGPARR